jgi:hypothetical protein
LEKTGYADEAPAFFYMVAYTMTDVKGSKSVCVRTTEHEKLTRSVMLKVMSTGRKLTPFVILKRKNFLVKHLNLT